MKIKHQAYSCRWCVGEENCSVRWPGGMSKCMRQFCLQAECLSFRSTALIIQTDFKVINQFMNTV